MNKKMLVILGLVIVVGLAALQLGCGGTDNANAASEDSDGKKTDAVEATNETQDGDEKSESDDAKGKKDKKGKKGKDGEEEEKTEEAVPVEVAALERGEIEAVLRFSANLEAERQVQVFSQAKRLVNALLVEEGDRVRRGQVLLRLQDEEQRSALAKVRMQLANEQREYERQQRLFEQELISEQLFNEAKYQFEELKISEQDAERELGYTEVRAPITGTVTLRQVNLGDQIQIGQHLFDIVDFDSLVARVFVPEKYLKQLRTGLPARLFAQSTRLGEYGGKLKRIAPIVDPRSGTVKVTVDVGGQEGLRPGMYVDVDLVTATHAEAVLVPKRALVYDNDQMFVYRLGEESRVERVFIEAALADKHNVEPVEGLAHGDRVVVAGQAGLKDGALVTLPGEKPDEDTSAGDTDSAPKATERASL